LGEGRRTRQAGDVFGGSLAREPRIGTRQIRGPGGARVTSKQDYE